MTDKTCVLINLEGSRNGLCSYDLANRAGIKNSTVRARIVDLVREGKVRDSGRREVIPTGHKATVWQVVGVHDASKPEHEQPVQIAGTAHVTTWRRLLRFFGVD